MLDIQVQGWSLKQPSLLRKTTDVVGSVTQESGADNWTDCYTSLTHLLSLFFSANFLPYSILVIDRYISWMLIYS